MSLIFNLGDYTLSIAWSFHGHMKRRLSIFSAEFLCRGIIVKLFVKGPQRIAFLTISMVLAALKEWRPIAIDS